MARSLHGQGLGAPSEVVGELVFNTSMTGYQEILTDPSYAGQLITFTFPHIGNVGTNDEDVEATHLPARGVVLRATITHPSSYRALAHLDRWLERQGCRASPASTPGGLTRHLRTAGAQRAASASTRGRSGPRRAAQLARGGPASRAWISPREVSCRQRYGWTETVWPTPTATRGRREPPPCGCGRLRSQAQHPALAGPAGCG